MCCMTSPPNNIIDAPSKYTVIVLRKWGRNNISSTSNFKLLWTSQMYNSSAPLEASSWLNISDYQIGSMVFLFTVFLWIETLFTTDDGQSIVPSDHKPFLLVSSTRYFGSLWRRFFTLVGHRMKTLVSSSRHYSNWMNSICFLGASSFQAL